MNAEFWLWSAVVVSGLWSGLLLTITTILHPMFAQGDGSGFRHDLGRFLPVARKSPTNYILVIALIVFPAIALFALRDAGVNSTFVLTAIGLVLTFTGAGMISRLAAEPNYDVILGWDEARPPTTWRKIRHKYFALNWIRGAFVWSAFACFIAATVQYGG